MTIRAILLDFDGVIVESIDIKTEAFRQLFAHEPEHLSAIIDFHLANGGLSRFAKFDAIYRDILHRPLPPGEKEYLGQRFAEFVVEQVLHSPYVPGALEFLQARSREMPLFVASGTPDDELRFILTQRGLDPYIREAHGSPRTKVEIARDILARYRWSAADVLLVGDALNDYRAALEVGLLFAGRVPNGATSPFPDRALIVRDLFDLEQYWQQIAGVRP